MSARHPHLANLTDKELAHHARNRPALSTLEAELLGRLVAWLDASDEQELCQARELRTKLEDAEAVLDALREELNHARPFVIALRAAGINDTGTLTKRLRIASAAINLFHTINH